MNIPAPFSQNQMRYFWNCFDHWFNVAEGGKRGGKNVLITMAYCTILEKHPSRIHLIAGVSTATARLNILDCDGFGLKNYFEGRCREGTYQNRDCLYIQTATGEKVVLVSGGGKAGDEKLIKGNTYGTAYITEANECSETFIKEVFDRTLSSPDRKVFHDLNPKAEGHWYYENILNLHEKKQNENPEYGFNYGHMSAAELAVIVTVPEAVLADSSFDIMGEVQPRVREAMGAKIDNAILFGGERPTEWTTDVLTLAAKNKVTGPIDYTKLLGKDGLFSKVEAGGFGVDAVVGDLTAKAELRGLLDTNGRPLFRSDMQGATTYALDGAPMYFPENGGFDASKAQLIAGNFKKLVYSIRQDVTVKLLDQGVIQDPSTKEIVYNLAQQDMVALRVVMRMGWALPNPATRMNADRSKVPFAFLTAAAVAA